MLDPPLDPQMNGLQSPMKETSDRDHSGDSTETIPITDLLGIQTTLNNWALMH